MGKTSTQVKNKWNAKAYDMLAVRVPKGQRSIIAEYANKHGESVNGMINRLIKAEMGE